MIKDTLIIKESGESHWKKEDKKNDKYYFEYRDGDGNEYTIEDRVVVNNIGCIETNRDILQDAIDLGINSSRDCVTDRELSKMYENISYV